MISHAHRRSISLSAPRPDSTAALHAPVVRALLPSHARRPGSPLARVKAWAESHPIEFAMIAPAPFVVVVMIAMHQTGALFWWLEHVVLPLR